MTEEGTNVTPPSDDELIGHVLDNDALALTELQRRYQRLIEKLSRTNDELRNELKSKLLECVVVYRGGGAFPALAKAALTNCARDFGRDQKRRGILPEEDSNGAPSVDGDATVGHDLGAGGESSSAVLLRAAPAGKKATTYRWTDEDHTKNAAFVAFLNGVSEAELREAARAARIKRAEGCGPDAGSDSAWHTESAEERTSREVGGIDGIARAVLKRPGYLDLLDAHYVNYGDEEQVRQAEKEIEQGLLKPPTSKLCPACRGLIKFRAVYCRHCRRWIDGGVGQGSETEATPLASAGERDPGVGPAKRLLDETCAKRVKDTIGRVARDRDERFSIGGRRPPGPANVRAFAEEAVRGAGKAPSLNALRVRKHRAEKKAAKKTGAPRSGPPGR